MKKGEVEWENGKVLWVEKENDMCKDVRDSMVFKKMRAFQHEGGVWGTGS